MKTFGEVLRSQRQKLGLSIREMSDATKIRHANICNIEAGRVRVGVKLAGRVMAFMGEPGSRALMRAYMAERKLDLEAEIKRNV